MQPGNRRSIDGVQRRPQTTKPPRTTQPSHEFAQEPQPNMRPVMKPVATPQRRRATQSAQPQQTTQDTKPKAAPEQLSSVPVEQSLSLSTKDKKHSLRRWILSIFGILFTAALAGCIAGAIWLQGELTPASEDTSKRIKVTIEQGVSTNSIGAELETSGVIKNRLAFYIYMKLSGNANKLQAGVYSLQPSLSTQAIVEHLMSGKADTFSVTLYPGGTVADAKKTLLGLGYDAQEIDAAFAKTYDRPLFATKPLSSDLEGYLYGETIEFDFSASVESILERFFDQFENFVDKNDLVALYKKRGLTLYQGIILASIVQREVPAEDMPAVARVFLNRIKQGMNLGSDVTYQYAAKKLGVDPSPSLDSPYNTRKFVGLPPGPIATPGASALLAVANPAKNDYLFFLSGDDDVTYFSKTDAGHQKNIAEHCHEKCLLP